jgi:hypothetical protein
MESKNEKKVDNSDVKITINVDINKVNMEETFKEVFFKINKKRVDAAFKENKDVDYILKEFKIDPLTLDKIVYELGIYLPYDYLEKRISEYIKTHRNIDLLKRIFMIKSEDMVKIIRNLQKEDSSIVISRFLYKDLILSYAKMYPLVDNILLDLNLTEEGYISLSNELEKEGLAKVVILIGELNDSGKKSIIEHNQREIKKDI